MYVIRVGIRVTSLIDNLICWMLREAQLNNYILCACMLLHIHSLLYPTPLDIALALEIPCPILRIALVVDDSSNFIFLLRNLSRHLLHMKQYQLKSSTVLTESINEGAGSNEETLKQRNSALQGRVEVLQEHNRRLEGCISQLRLISELVSCKRKRERESEVQ